MDIRYPFNTVWICVRDCPKMTLNSPDAVYDLEIKTGTSYLMYDVDNLNYTRHQSSNIGPHPIYPILRR